MARPCRPSRIRSALLGDGVTEGKIEAAIVRPTTPHGASRSMSARWIDTGRTTLKPDPSRVNEVRSSAGVVPSPKPRSIMHGDGHSKAIAETKMSVHHRVRTRGSLFDPPTSTDYRVLDGV
jgi:hypothetical protein